MDRYGRTVAEVTLPDGMSLNRELVKQGWCWWFRKYAPNDTELKDLEASARRQQIGIWSDPQPVPPWEFRKARAEQRARKKGVPQLKLASITVRIARTTVK
jgi:endonuclease YncB( thermonuclease family)